MFVEWMKQEGASGAKHAIWDMSVLHETDYDMPSCIGREM